MNLHEYQSKELFELYNLPVSKRGLITKLSDIDEALEKIDFSNGCVAKVQAHTGGRGKVGGVELCKTKEEIENFVNNDIDDTSNYQINRAKAAIANGKIFGVGAGKSSMKYVLPQSTSVFYFFHNC